jgi:spore maturation protein CgeB
MKILIVGSNNVWAIENTYIKYLKEKHEVTLFNAHGDFLNYYHKNLINKIFFRLGLSNILSTINKNLLSYTKDYQPDIIWVFKGMEIFPETLKKFKLLNIKLVNYNGDHPFQFLSRGSGNKNVLNSISLYDHHFSYSSKVVQEINRKYKVQSSWLPFAYVNAKPAIKNERDKICFIGNPDKERIRIIELLIFNKIPIDVFGIGWEKHFESNKIIRIHGPIFSEEFISIAQKYRVQLNIFRPHNEGSHNMRTFEMPALGCIMLAPYSIEHEELFLQDKEAFYFKNDKELIEKSNFILSLSENEAYEIGYNAYKRAIKSNYTYKDRTNQIIACFEKLIQ